MADARIVETRASRALTHARSASWEPPSEEQPQVSALLEDLRQGMSDEMRIDIQAGPARPAATPIQLSTLAGLVLFAMTSGSWALAQDASASQPAPAQTAPDPLAAPAPPGAVDSKAASPATSPIKTGGPAATAAQTVGSLPSDLSPWSMFLNADIVVKIVMIGLAFASVVTWTVWLAKGLELVLGETAGACCKSQAPACQKPRGRSARGSVRMDAERPRGDPRR